MVTLLLLRLLFAFAAVMMFATVVVLVTRPIYLRIHGWVARPVLAAVITTVLLGTVVAMPLAFLGVAFVQQALEFGQRGMAFVQDGGIATSIDAFSQQAGDSLPAAVADVLPDSTELTVLASDVLQTMTMGGLQQVTSQLPSIIASTGGLAIDAFVFLGAVGTLYVKGPALLKIVRDLVPLQEAYFDALFEVFGDLANRAVGGTVATALIQGLIATLGYAIAGVDGLVFFGSLTVLFAFVPLVGGAVIYLPLVVSTWIDHGARWALFLLVWQIVLTAQVDTFLRPLFLRGQTAIHPLLIFMAVFGGLGWLGFPGALAGPLILVAFLALYTIYTRDFQAGVAPSPG